MQFCIVCQSLINSVRLLYNEHFESLNAVDNVVFVNETDRLCCIEDVKLYYSIQSDGIWCCI